MEYPDTTLVREARAIVHAALPESITEHSLRVFLLGTAYAKATKREGYDEEGFALAAIFHDLGLADGAKNEAFTRASSRALSSFLEAHGAPTSRIAPLTDAIDFHMQLFPRWSKGNVAGLLHVGAWMDVMGLRRGSIRQEAARIAREHPRGSFTTTFFTRLLSMLWRPSACFGLLFPPSSR